MPIVIIQERQRIEAVKYMICFDFPKQRHCGYAFDCDASGALLPSATESARANFAQCQTGADARGAKLDAPYIQEFDASYTEPRIGRCVCGADVYLDRFTNTCDACERDYDSSGYRLAPRSQWGYDTGESVADILAADSDYAEYRDNVR